MILLFGDTTRCSYEEMTSYKYLKKCHTKSAMGLQQESCLFSPSLP